MDLYLFTLNIYSIAVHVIPSQKVSFRGLFYVTSFNVAGAADESQNAIAKECYARAMHVVKATCTRKNVSFVVAPLRLVGFGRITVFAHNISQNSVRKFIPEII